MLSVTPKNLCCRGWIRTTVVSFKGRCPASRRPDNSWNGRTRTYDHLGISEGLWPSELHSNLKWRGWDSNPYLWIFSPARTDHLRYLSQGYQYDKELSKKTKDPNLFGVRASVIVSYKYYIQTPKPAQLRWYHFTQMISNILLTRLWNRVFMFL